MKAIVRKIMLNNIFKLFYLQKKILSHLNTLLIPINNTNKAYNNIFLKL